MRPKKKRAGHEQPDTIVDEVPDTIGGTDGEELGDDEDWVKAEVEQGGGYSRPQEQGEEDEYI